MKLASLDDFENQLCQWIKSKNDKDFQYNDASQLKNFLVLKLPHFFAYRIGDGKKRQFQNQEVLQLSCVFLILTVL